MDKVKGYGEAVADYALAFVFAYLLWSLGFNLPVIPVVHEFIGIIAAVGVFYLAVKVLRSIRLTTPR